MRRGTNSSQAVRQPSKSGRHDAVPRISPPPAKGRIKNSVAPGTSVSGLNARTSKARYQPTDPARVAEILRCLDQLYPEATCALTHKSAWELLVATILSAQATDVRVNMVTPTLFEKYPTVAAFAALQPEQLQPDIRSTGFFRNKSKSVIGAAKKLLEDFNGQVPDDMEKLLTVPGVARKTANVVLGTWFKKGVGVVVDTHVHRISRRLELTKNDDPKKIEQDLMRVIPPEKWILFAHQVIWHGRKLCIARRPKCVECPLEKICHAADKTWTTVEIHKNARP